MKINSGNTNTEPRIELVPLIDVIFCILTFFLLAGLQVARQQAIGVDIPSATTGTPAARELLMVSLNDAGQLFLEQQPMLVPGQLIEAVKQYRQARPNSSIVLYASKQVSYNKVVEVLDALRGVAGDRVALATLPSNTAAPTPPVIPNPTGYGYPYNPYNPYQGVNPATTVQPNTGAPTPATGAATQPIPVTPTTQPIPAVTPAATTTPSVAPIRSPKP
ncbi:ExbD/TolR family protein [Chamaesiphon minutus]|uniref:Biopolymer transport protein n=1 Tax=Chamaesiphon minutus (strain ATCC 27169 / PCC 6605) TaxID=1173020 RepID=K9UPY2_CHAP6|nr:biopolymer transporter ExbD [Chamaesiphon minutus]AFY96496.1 biopolymer transport protein [Chamaesiphon minutus PCC 6605]